MKANYENTSHSKIKRDVYNDIADLFFTSVTYFLIDKMGYNKRKTYYMLQYIQGIIEGINSGNTNLQDLKNTLEEESGITITKKSRGISIFLKEEERSD